jgi:hypothetical protein
MANRLKVETLRSNPSATATAPQRRGRNPAVWAEIFAAKSRVLPAKSVFLHTDGARAEECAAFLNNPGYA